MFYFLKSKYGNCNRVSVGFKLFSGVNELDSISYLLAFKFADKYVIASYNKADSNILCNELENNYYNIEHIS